MRQESRNQTGGRQIWQEGSGLDGYLWLPLVAALLRIRLLVRVVLLPLSMKEHKA